VLVKIAVPKTNVDEKKAKQAILYICNRMSNCPGFGSIMLNKVLYYADHTHFLKNGKTITGFGYIKQKFGPTPKPAEFLTIKENLKSERKLGEKQVEVFGHFQKRPVALVPHDVSCFSSSEVADLDEIISAFSGATGTMVSDLSHSSLAWKLADLMEELPHFTYLLTESQLEEKDLKWGRSQIEAHKLSCVR
jgi:hypothetical protein